MRTCIACRQKRAKQELCRIVRCADSASTSISADSASTSISANSADTSASAAATQATTLKLDESGKMAGRGSYVCYDKGCFKKMKEKGLLAGRLRCKVKKEAYERLEKDFEAALLKRHF